MKTETKDNIITWGYILVFFASLIGMIVLFEASKKF